MKRNNNGIFYVAISLVAVLAIGSVVAAYTATQNVNVTGDYNYYEAKQPVNESSDLGAVSGPDIYWDTNVYGSLSYGGGDYNSTSTEATTYTLDYKDLDATYLSVDNNDNSLTWTLPATSTMIGQFLPEVGSTRTWYIENTVATDDKTITLAAGDGMDMQVASSSDLVIPPQGWAALTCINIVYDSTNDEDVMCNMDKWVAGD